MPPEQLEGGEADARSDIFFLGATLYEMATGQKAFPAKSQASLIAEILKAQPRPISELQPLVPPALERIVTTCLSKDPDDRWQSAGDLKRELVWISSAGSLAGVPAPVIAQRKTREADLEDTVSCGRNYCRGQVSPARCFSRARRRSPRR